MFPHEDIRTLFFHCYVITADTATPSSVLISPITVYAGNAVTLTCEMSDPGNPPPMSYTWYYQGSEVKVTPENSYTFNVTSVEQEGHYTCANTNIPLPAMIVISDQSPPSQLTINGK